MLNITFNNNSVVQNISKEIKGIEDISIGEDQKLTFTYNTGASKTFEEPLNYIEEVKRDSDSESDTYNHLLIKHSDPVRGWQDLGGLNYTMVADEIFIDDESTEEEIAQSFRYILPTTFIMTGITDNKRLISYDLPSSH